MKKLKGSKETATVTHLITYSNATGVARGIEHWGGVTPPTPPQLGHACWTGWTETFRTFFKVNL